MWEEGEEDDGGYAGEHDQPGRPGQVQHDWDEERAQDGDEGVCEVPVWGVGAIELAKVVNNAHLEEVKRCESPAAIEQRVQQEDQQYGDEGGLQTAE